ncbi:MAG: peptidase U34 [Spirochaetes bacterium]|nr:MAG: peptidase U34 [Spirochaetota bacterium]
MCDTIVAVGAATFDGSVILAKNSDREPNEAQLLYRVPAARFAKGETLRCTFLTIPQARITQEVLISRPFWMWGCEIGVNASGVAIGNEAVFTREPYAKTGLTGMDLMRLALERTSTAQDALVLITDLIAEHGQGGNCGYQHKLFYHNSFIIADKTSAWVLETAGRHWVAKKVRTIGSISNGITIEEDFDLSSKGLEDYARGKGYLKPHENFSFRRAFSDTLITYFSQCKIRQSRTHEMLAAHEGAITPARMMGFLRDHGADPLQRPPHKTSMGTVCMHASFGPLRASQSTSSMVAHLRKDVPVYWATGTSGPCTSTFVPYYLAGRDIAYLDSECGKTFSNRVLWWRHELLHRQALSRYSAWHRELAPHRDTLEAEFISKEGPSYKKHRKATAAGKNALMKFSKECFDKANVAREIWTARLANSGVDRGIPLRYRYFWSSQGRKAAIPL